MEAGCKKIGSEALQVFGKGVIRTDGAREPTIYRKHCGLVKDDTQSSRRCIYLLGALTRPVEFDQHCHQFFFICIYYELDE